MISGARCGASRVRAFFGFFKTLGGGLFHLPFFISMNLRHLAVAMTALHASAALAQQTAQPAARLFATDDGACVRLQWHPLAWEADQTGYALARRPVAGGSWQRLGGVLSPSFDPARDGRSLGMNAEQSAAFTEWASKSGAASRKAVAAEKFRAMLSQSKALPVGNRIEMSRDGHKAFSLGLGYCDNTRGESAECEYGLFVARQGDRVDANPIAIVRPLSKPERGAWAKQSGFATEVVPSEKKLSVFWRMPVSFAQRMAVDTFRLERRRAADAEWEAVQADLPYSLQGGEARWNAFDAQPLTPPFHYRLVVRDMFGAEYPAHEWAVSTLADEAPTSLNLGPKSLAVKASGAGAAVTWSHEKPKWRNYTLQGYRVLGVFSGYKGPLLDAAKHEVTFSADECKKIGQVRVEAVYVAPGGGEMPVPSIETVTPSGAVKANLVEIPAEQTKVSPVTGASAAFYSKNKSDATPYVKITWTPPAQAKAIRVLAIRNGEPHREAEVAGASREAVVPWYPDMGSPLRYQIVVLNDKNKESEPVSVSVSKSGASLACPTNLKTIIAKDGRSYELRWEIENENGLLGYRVYSKQNGEKEGKVIKGMEKLPKGTTSVNLPYKPGEPRQSCGVQAFSGHSESLVMWRSVRSIMASKSEVMPLPAGVAAKWGKDKAGKPCLHVTWTPPVPLPARSFMFGDLNSHNGFQFKGEGGASDIMERGEIFIPQPANLPEGELFLRIQAGKVNPEERGEWKVIPLPRP